MFFKWRILAKFSRYLFIISLLTKGDMNTKTTMVIFAAVAVLAVALAPALVDYASARKQETCTLPSGNPCTGATADKNPNTEKKCTAGSKDQTNANCP